MKTPLLDFLADEITERVVRIDLTLEFADSTVPSTELPLVDSLRRVFSVSLRPKLLDGLVSWSQVRSRTRREGTEQDTIDHEIQYCFNQFIHVNALFQLIHHHLGLLSTRWTGSEITIFIRELFKRFPVNPDRICIAPSRNYVFAENDLAVNIEAALNPRRRYSGGETVIVSLPRVDLSNPLNWTIVAHEAAHMVMKTDEIERLLSDAKSKTTRHTVDAVTNSIWHSWIDELLADFLAAKLLGDSYLLSLVFYSLGLLRSPANYSATHPDMSLRIDRLVTLFLNEPDIIPGLSEEMMIKPAFLVPPSFPDNKKVDVYMPGTGKGVGAGLLDLIFQRIKFSSGFGRGSSEGVPPLRGSFPDSEQPLFEVLRPVISQALVGHLRPRVVSTNETESLQVMRRKLSEGIPIGASASEMNDQQIADWNLKIDTFKGSFKGGRESPASVEQFRNELFGSVSQAPSTVDRILNAGWLYRLTDGHALFIDKFGQIHPNLDTKKKTSLLRGAYEDYRKHIARRDRLLLKSIETVYFCRQFGEHP